MASAPLGCAGDLELRLLPAGFDDPYAAVVRLTVEVLDADYAPLATFDAAPGAFTEVGVASPGPGRRIRVTGLGVGGQAVALGHSQPLQIDGASGVALVPFASRGVAVAVPVVESGRGAWRTDGLLDEWVGVPSLLLDDRHRVAGPSRPDVRAELLVAWDFDQLRFAIRVIDRCAQRRRSGETGGCAATPTTGGVILGLDGVDSRRETFGPGAFLVAIRPEGIRLLAGELAPDQLPAAYGELGGGEGWVVEGAVELAALARVAIAQRDRIGLEIAVLVGEATEAPTLLRLSGAAGPAEALVTPAEMGTLGFGSR